MRPQDVFDVCLERYLGLRDWVSRGIGAVQLDVPAASGGYQWRPDRARAADYVADFERAGRRVLARPNWKGRHRLFEIYFCRGVEYRRAIVTVGVSTGTFDWWVSEIKKAVGRELGRAGLFPPSRYFRVRI